MANLSVLIADWEGLWGEHLLARTSGANFDSCVGLLAYVGKNILQYYCNPTCNINIYCNVSQPGQYILQCLATRAIDIAMSRDPGNRYCNDQMSTQ